MAGWTFNIGPGAYAEGNYNQDTAAVNFGYNLGLAAIK